MLPEAMDYALTKGCHGWWVRTGPPINEKASHIVGLAFAALARDGFEISTATGETLALSALDVDYVSHPPEPSDLETCNKHLGVQKRTERYARPSTQFGLSVSSPETSHTL